jgi:hypothetical protein
MSRILFLSLACLILTVPAFVMADDPAPNTLTDAEKEAGFELLFDGDSMENFRGYKKDEVHDGWEIIDGAITRVTGGGDIITREQYAEFELVLEYRISKGGNSGIMFHVTEEDGPSYLSGPEIQVQDNVDGHDPQKSGWLYQFYSSEVDATNPVGEWNEMRIVISEEKCSTHMNGTLYYEFVLNSDDWNERLAKTKFATWPLFNKSPVGHVALQDHGNEVAYRSIRIREINADEE